MNSPGHGEGECELGARMADLQAWKGFEGVVGDRGGRKVGRQVGGRSLCPLRGVGVAATLVGASSSGVVNRDVVSED